MSRIWPIKTFIICSPHLDDVRAGVFGVCADKHSEEGGGGRHRSENLLEVALVPGFRQTPSSDLEQTGIKQTFRNRWDKEMILLKRDGHDFFWRLITVPGWLGAAVAWLLIPQSWFHSCRPDNIAGPFPQPHSSLSLLCFLPRYKDKLHQRKTGKLDKWQIQNKNSELHSYKDVYLIIASLQACCAPRGCWKNPSGTFPQGGGCFLSSPHKRSCRSHGRDLWIGPGLPEPHWPRWCTALLGTSLGDLLQVGGVLKRVKITDKFTFSIIGEWKTLPQGDNL